MDSVSEPVQRVRPLLGTFVGIEAEGAVKGESAISAAFAAFERVERLMRPSTAGSDVARISAAANGDALRIDPASHDHVRPGLDDEIDVAGGEHAIGVAVAAVAR